MAVVSTELWVVEGATAELPMTELSAEELWLETVPITPELAAGLVEVWEAEL